ncbi:MAG TPA: MFS transporter [Ktedonobacterales bacterium]|nr:MFS transporter [Ktedonobacterales bacterium]
MIATLRQRNFALLWFAGLISLAGDWVLSVGLPIYVYLLTRSVLATSILLLAVTAPSVLVGSLAGVFVDRWDRKRTMVWTNLLLAAGLLPLLLVRSADHVWIVYAVAIVESSVEQFFIPAKNAVLPTLVGEERIVQANSLNGLNNNLARLLGPAFGGVVAGFFGIPGIVVADAVSFLLAAALIAGIAASAMGRKTARAGSHAEIEPGTVPPVLVGAVETAPAEVTTVGDGTSGGNVLREWAAGLKVIARERTLAVVLLALAIISLGEGVMGTLFPVFVNQRLHGEALAIGELMSAQAVGGLLGGVLYGWLGKRVMSRWALGVSGVLFGLLDLAIFNAPTLLPGAGLPLFAFELGFFVAVGIPGIGLNTGMMSLAQGRSPEAYRGRVFGVVQAVMSLLMLIGTVIAGTVTDRLGVVTLLNIQGGGYVVAGLLLWLLLPRRQPGLASPPERAEAEAHEPVAAQGRA